MEKSNNSAIYNLVIIGANWTQGSYMNYTWNMYVDDILSSVQCQKDFFLQYSLENSENAYSPGSSHQNLREVATSCYTFYLCFFY